MANAHAFQAQQFATQAPNTTKEFEKQALSAPSPVSIPAAQRSTIRRDPTTFFTLPRELRGIVYELATRDIEVWPGPQEPKWGVNEQAIEDMNTKEQNSLNSGLLQVSKQIRSETLVPYLQNTLFTFEKAHAASEWFLSVPPTLRPALGVLRIGNVSPAKMTKLRGDIQTDQNNSVMILMLLNQLEKKCGLESNNLGRNVSWKVKVMREVFKVSGERWPDWRVEFGWQQMVEPSLRPRVQTLT